MAIKPVVQLIPPGLLSFFGIKNGGINPTDIQAQLVPTLPMLDWYLMSEFETTQLLVSNFTLGFQGGRQVPQGEWWYCLNATATWLVPAGGSFSAQMALTMPGQLGGTFARVGQVASSNVVGATLMLPSMDGFWMPPGTFIGINVLQNTAAAAPATFNMAFTRIAV